MCLFFINDNAHLFIKYICNANKIHNKDDLSAHGQIKYFITMHIVCTFFLIVRPFALLNVSVKVNR